MTRPTDLMRRLDALAIDYPAQAVVAAVHRLEADPHADLSDIGDEDSLAVTQARKLHAVITAMRAASGGAC